MQNEHMEYLVFQAPLDANGGSGNLAIKCVVKNTFLEIVEADSPANIHCARIRSHSESRLSLRRPSFDKDDEVAEEKFDMMGKLKIEKTVSSVSTSVDGDGSASDSSRDWLDEPGNVPRTDSPTPSDARNEPRKAHFQVPEEILESLHELTDLVAEEQFKREDLQNYPLIEQLYPYIPVDDKGNVTSLGSILHAQGDGGVLSCKPCAFMKKDRCHKKDLCLFCHFPHDGPSLKANNTRNRKSSSKRKRESRQRFCEEENSEAVRVELAAPAALAAPALPVAPAAPAAQLLTPSHAAYLSMPSPSAGTRQVFAPQAYYYTPAPR